MKNPRISTLAAALAALLVAACPAGAAPAEGYDPLRQITQQLLKANLLILQDITGSMAWYPDYGQLSWAGNPTNGDDSVGALFWNAGTAYTGLYKGQTVGGVAIPSVTQAGVGGSTTPTGACTTPCRYWYYLLTYEGPARLATVKNVLGNSLPLVTSYTPPPQSGMNSTWATAGNKVTITPIPVDTTKTLTKYVSAWLYTYDYGATSGKNNSGTNPGRPFDPCTTTPCPTTASTGGGFPRITNGTCAVGSCTYLPPADIVGTNADRINWGLTTFTSNSGGTTTRVQIDTSDLNANLAKLEDYMYYSGSTGPNGLTTGLSSGGGTTTIAGFATAKTEIVRAANADSTAPSIKLSCGRPYGVILVTDGMSNTGNPSDADWINPCGAGPTACDATGSPNDCPSAWKSYAAGSTSGSSDDLYTKTKNSAGVSVPVHTWAIGVSTAVGPCELDYIAYRGRTDANSPDGSAGYTAYDATTNPYIPKPGATENADPRLNYTAGSTQFDGPTGQYYWNGDATLTRGTATPTYATILAAGKTFDAAVAAKKSHGHNAFFAQNATDLADALTTIVNASAAGDYTTSAPVSGLSVGIGQNVYLASTDFPAWAGRLQAIDTSKIDGSTGTYKVVWEAGAVLKARTSARSVYTWDPLNSNALVKITTTDSTLPGKLSTLSGATITPAVIDFILGGDGTGVKRANVLGPIINSTPAIVGAPSIYYQTNVINHQTFETNYASRTPLLWVGSDDGMLHAFRVQDAVSSGTVTNPGGEEILAIIPPSLLATEVTLYDQFVANGLKGTGQPVNFKTHYYGAANSLRFADVYNSTWGDYKTVGFMTIGPGVTQDSGGTITAGQYELFAVDITHPTTGDPNYSSSAPVSILWSKKVGDITGYSVPWSVPAVAPVSSSIAPAAPGSSTFRLVLGSGYNNRNTGGTGGSQVTGTNFQSPKLFVLDPITGGLQYTIDSASVSAIKSPATPTPYVGNQSFADAVFLDKMAKVYQNDNLADLALQADLYGRIWFVGTSSGIAFDSAKLGIDVQGKAGQPQPVYYPPAASGVGDPAQGTSTSPGCTLFAFGSGTLYEKATTVTGAGVGTTGFIPSLYVGAAKKPYPWNDSAKLLTNTNAVDTTNGLFRLAINALPRPTTDPYYSSTNKTLSTTSQLTGPPYLLVSKNGATASTALFLVYDPSVGCNGYSYVIQVDVQPTSTCAVSQTPYSSSNTSSTTVVTVYGAGPGAASGFTVAGNEIVVAKSGIGSNAAAGIYKPPVPTSLTGSASPVRPLWWRELK